VCVIFGRSYSQSKVEIVVGVIF